MAKPMHAISRYGPRLAPASPATDDELADQVAAGTNASPHMARMMLAQLSDALLYFLRRGSSVRVPGIGRFRAIMATVACDCTWFRTSASSWPCKTKSNSRPRWSMPSVSAGPMPSTRCCGTPSSPKIRWRSS
ncbi:MAG: hypothetical protein IPJ58_16770 [Ardenticatenia bacterium]|nr:hypothetical protein [Ardenticatenia bacterium]